MSTSTFLVRLATALCSTTASGGGADTEFDPRLHKVIGVQTNQEKALLSLQEELVLEIGVLQVTFDAAKKHSEEEKAVQQQMTLVSNFYDLVDDLVDMSLFERFSGRNDVNPVLIALNDGNVLLVRQEQTLQSSIPQPQRRMMQ